MKNIGFYSFVLLVALYACKKDEEDTIETTTTKAEPQLIFKLKFDSTQARLNNFGAPSTVPVDHGSQSPVFNSLSAHYIELTPDELTQVGDGFVAYVGDQTNLGRATAVDFDKAIVVGQNGKFTSIPLKDVDVGTYNYIRVSVTYQNYDIKMRLTNLPIIGSIDLTGTLASFVGFNNYITTYKIKDSTLTVNDDKLQGYWAFETIYNVTKGQTAVGATTVPNPIFATSPIPDGSCLVTGEFETPLTISGNETEDIIITISLSTNQSFEWSDLNGNNIYEPLDGDTVADMGLRGLIPIVE